MSKRLVITFVSKTLYFYSAGLFIISRKNKNGGVITLKNHVYKKYAHVFQPLRVKNIIYNNRLCSTTMSTVPTHIHLSSTNYGGIGIYDKARGGVAMIGMMYHGTAGSSLYEANGADPFSKYNLDVLRESLSVVKQGGALAGFAVGMGNIFEGEIYTPSGLPFARPHTRQTKVMNEKIMNHLIDTVVEKAKKASRFGFDLLILDISNDNIVGHFMAPGFNHRTDQWGGSYENRFRLAHIIVNKIREAIGEDFVLELRVSATLGVEETYSFDEMLKFLKSIENKIDIVNIVTGMDEYHDGNVKLCPPIFEKHMLNYEVAKKIKETCKVIVNVSGAIMNLNEAEKMLADNVADLILIGRSIVADPYMPKKILAGKEDDVVPCIRCNNCYHIATEHFNTCCSVNPRIYRENRVPLKLEKTVHPQKIVIIGAGPAGLKTALTAYEKGHHVTIIDENDDIGGALIQATKGELKQDLAAYLHYLRTQVKKSSIKLILRTTATKELIQKEQPDVLIIAIGAKAIVPKIKGIDCDNVLMAADFLDRGFEQASQKTTILGAGSIGCEIALELANMGKEINLIEMSDTLAKNGNELYRVSLLQHILNHPHIHIMTESQCIEVMEKACLVKTKDKILTIPHNEFIIAVGYRQDIKAVYQYFDIIPETRYVGDCKRVASVTEAVTEGYFLGASL